MIVRPSWPRAFLLAAAAAAAAAAVPGWAANAAPAAPAVAPRPAFAGVPGPDAEYLAVTDRYTVRADGAVVHERESRLQVNSFLAISRAYGETKVGWNPETETCEVLADRTVLPSGAVVEAPANAVVDDQPPGAERDPLWSGLRRKVIVHTGLEPGAVIEESWRITHTHGATPSVRVLRADRLRAAGTGPRRRGRASARDAVRLGDGRVAGRRAQPREPRWA